MDAIIVFEQCPLYRNSREAPEDVDFIIKPQRRRLFITSFLQTRHTAYATLRETLSRFLPSSGEWGGIPVSVSM